MRPPSFMNDALDHGVRVADVDGDGLPDFVRGYTSGGSTTTAVFINNGDGTGWTQDTDYSVPLYFVNSGTDDLGVRLADINGDGLADFIRADGNQQ